LFENLKKYLPLLLAPRVSNIAGDGQSVLLNAPHAKGEPAPKRGGWGEVIKNKADSRGTSFMQLTIIFIIS
jgi:hypothetical protein